MSSIEENIERRGVMTAIQSRNQFTWIYDHSFHPQDFSPIMDASIPVENTGWYAVATQPLIERMHTGNYSFLRLEYLKAGSALPQGWYWFGLKEKPCEL